MGDGVRFPSGCGNRGAISTRRGSLHSPSGREPQPWPERVHGFDGQWAPHCLASPPLEPAWVSGDWLERMESPSIAIV